ncbi:MAG: hypothetical protein IKZ78_04035, partial [Firmicutes bacterium]|nr:hypothetical protein [Bacillota bacterium]
MSGMTVTAWAVDSVSYLDSSGATQTAYGVTAVTDQTTWGAANQITWYVANSNKTINDLITVSGTVNLILADDCTLTTKGIDVAEGNTLNIYGQSGNTGKLIASSNSYISGYAYFSGIGGYSKTSDDYATNCGTITINGGIIEAKGIDAAGIGSTKYPDCGIITINGGNIT